MTDGLGGRTALVTEPAQIAADAASGLGGAVNVRATLLLIQALAPGMIERGGGSIVSLSSVSAIVGTCRSAYAATKGAVDGGMARTIDLYAGAD